MSAESAVGLDPRVSAYLEERGRLCGVEVVALSGDASTRRYFRLRDGDGTQVLALYPEPFEASQLPFIVVRNLMAEWRLPVPRILDQDGPRGVVLLEDLGDVTLQEALTHSSEDLRRAYYAQAVAQIAQLQREAARCEAAAPCFEIAFDVEKLDWELQYFLKHFLEGHRGVSVAPEERAALSAELRALAAEIASWPRVLCHRDYHSRNLMAQGTALFWIDFQDARMGPATYDLASLLRDAYVDLSEEFIDASARDFRRVAVPDEPEDVFMRRFDLTCTQRNLKALGTFGYMDVVRGNRIYVQYIPRTLVHARRNLVKHPELARLHALLSKHIPELS